MPHPSHYKRWFDVLEKIDLRRHLSEVEFILIESSLKKNNGSITDAAKSLKINRTTLIEKMKKYSIPKLGWIKNLKAKCFIRFSLLLSSSVFSFPYIYLFVFGFFHRNSEDRIFLLNNISITSHL